jgi:hypothetical protein
MITFLLDWLAAGQLSKFSGVATSLFLRCTKANTAMIRNKTIAGCQPLPAFVATPATAMPAKNKMT